MSSDERIEQLVQAYLDGTSSAADTAELAMRLRDDQAAAAAFARAARFEDLLESHFVEQRQARKWSEESSNVAFRPPRRRRALVAVGAALAACAVGVLWWQENSNVASAAAHRVVSGHVLVDGVETKSFPDGSHLEVVGATNAAIHLTDGSDIEFTPATTAIVRAGGEGAVVSLDYGNGKFRNGADHRPLRVDTPLGSVSGTEAEFAVDLQSTDPSEALAVGANVPALLIVAVLTGQVEVQEADQKVKVSAGESRAFSQEKRPRFTGKVVAVAPDGKRISLEGKPGKAGAPPQRRDVLITDETQLTYFGVTKEGDRPTVGYTADATLDKASPEKAVAVEFGDKFPSIAGVVKKTSDDGRTLTIEVYPKGEMPLERTITLDERTRTSYAGIDAASAKPTVGQHVSAWLVGETDKAAEIRFKYNSKGSRGAEQTKIPAVKKPAPTAMPSAPYKKPKSKAGPAEKPDAKPMSKLKVSKSSINFAPKQTLRRESSRAD